MSRASFTTLLHQWCRTWSLLLRILLSLVDPCTVLPHPASFTTAGEEGGPEYVWGAIRVLRVQRIDHGIRSLEDAELVQYMVDTRLPITLCPLSNLRLQVNLRAK
jgi:hypothetical protein